MNYRKWTESEANWLLKEVASRGGWDGKLVRLSATRLGRSYSSVYRQLQQLEQKGVIASIGTETPTSRLHPLNSITHDLKTDKDYVEVVLIGDIHYGADTCDRMFVESTFDYCSDHNIPIIGMGDMLESSTRYSVGQGVYKQLSPNEQLAWIRSLYPTQTILAWLTGNHEERIPKETGVDIYLDHSDTYRFPYLGHAGWVVLRVGSQVYRLRVMHGRSGSKNRRSKMNKAVSIAKSFDCDLFAMGHVHSLDLDEVHEHKVCADTGRIINQTKHVVLTGHFLDFENSYAEEHGMDPSPTGCPLIRLYKSLHLIEVDLHWQRKVGLL